jgi:2-methylisocitrate lyase-like PEP mutase family enzyme
MTVTMPERFRMLHQAGTFVLPNPWDIGSARILESLGAVALATTSAGHAASKGRLDQNVSMDEVLAHAEELIGAIDIPLNLDSERCFAETPEGVLANARRLAETGAAGFSIEDYDPVTGGIDPIERAVERVAAAVEGAASTGAMVTARTENHLYGVDDLDDTVARLQAFVGAGAAVVYAPGLVDLAAIARVVDEIDAPVNVLAFGRGPTVAELASVGVRRVSTGSGLARAAHGALVSAATELLEVGTFSFLSGSSTDGSFAAVPISRSRLDAAFGH